MDVSIPKSKYGGVDQIIEHINAPVVMHSHTRFLDYGIYTGIVDLQGCGKCYWSQGTVGGKTHIKGLCHCGNFFHFRYSSGMANVRLDNICAPKLKNSFIIPS